MNQQQRTQHLARCIRQVSKHKGQRGGLLTERSCAARLGGSAIDRDCAAAAGRIGDWLRTVGGGR